jgi:hypothetical protein
MDKALFTGMIFIFRPGGSMLAPNQSEHADTTCDKTEDEDKSAERIKDWPFCKAYRELRNLSDYVKQSCTQFAPAGTTDSAVTEAAKLGKLNTMRLAGWWSHSRARRATGPEWEEVERRSAILWNALTEEQRRKFASTQVPGWFSYVMSGLLAIAMGSVVFAVVLQQAKGFSSSDLLTPFMAFMIALGSMGASASIGMNALSVQDDASFNISIKKFLWLRLVLGALFGTILSFPLGVSGFH